METGPLARSHGMLDGKVALVTGASRGLGRAIAEGLATAGADLVLASRRRADCEPAAEQARRCGRRVLTVSCDVGKWAQTGGLVDAALAGFGRVDVLVNNAGIAPAEPASAELGEALFDRIFAVNAKGPLRLAALIGAHMAAAGGGSIVNISSLSAMRPHAHNRVYAASKAALVAGSQGMALELAPAGVRVNIVTPGVFETDIAADWIARNGTQGLSAMRRAGAPPEIVAAVLYFAGEAASFTTGANLRVDGGRQ